MNFDAYQSKARATAVYPETHKIIYPSLGLNSESGEVAGKVKKYIRDGVSISELKEQLRYELGDVLWYVAILADDVGLSLNEIAKANLYKLRLRQKNNKLHGSGDYR